MSKADRHHVFFESKWPEQKNTHGVDIIYVVWRSRQMNFSLFCFLQEGRLCCSARKLITHPNELHPSHCAGVRPGSASRGATTGSRPWQKAVRWAQTLIDPSSEEMSLNVTLSCPGAPLCLPVGRDCQIRSQEFPSDVCWGGGACHGNVNFLPHLQQQGLFAMETREKEEKN